MRILYEVLYMATHKSTWKRRERDIAAFFFSERTPLSGGNSKQTRSDSLSKHFFVEAKLREHYSVAELFRNTAKLAKVEGKVPVVALCEKHQEGFMLLVSKEDFPRLARMYLRQRALQTAKSILKRIPHAHKH